MSGKAWLSWSRIDGRALEAVLGLALLLVGLFGALFPLLGVTGPFPPVDSREVRIDDLTQVPGAASAGDVTLRGTHTGELAFSHPDFIERLLLALPGLVQTLLLLVMLELLLRMARTLRDGDVFVAQNARRLGVVAVALAVTGTLVPLVTTVTTDLLVSGTDVASAVPVSYELSVPYVLLALLVAATAEAFRQGTRLRADTEGLV
ncbi:DUF2975 domain-containing protein [Actinomadura barringtoniae]|uniref:DUF2975 domain-containing protein n=1 Tax=Actinomadura barringtoniae TaxID=1427535 RepID=A0A939P8M8_9ACTN|nr:DUF2975 domain-containing protein [Actinomadura barringtoniae]MBO2447780.1 DUF2975 domain-containing protein [Actinomadura barringtoniae]